MTENKLNKLKFLENDIYNLKRDIQDIDKILNDYESYGSNIDFKKGRGNVKDLSGGHERSFESKKYNFRTSLKNILQDLKFDCEERLKIKQQEFNNL